MDTTSVKTLFTKQNYVSREEWKAEEPRIKRVITKPALYVVFNYTDTLGCETKDECLTRVLDIQTCQMSTCRLTDIKYNFLIGGDGRIYEGRGWKHYPQNYESYHKLNPINKKCIEIAFICKKGSRVTEDMQKAAILVVQEGINQNKLNKDLKVTTVWLESIIPKDIMKINNVRLSRHVQSNVIDTTTIA